MRLFLIILTSFTLSYSADWKFVGFKGGSLESGQLEIILFEKNSVRLYQDGNVVRVWVECGSVEKGADTSILSIVVDNVQKGYTPPIFSVSKQILTPSAENILHVGSWEILANKLKLKCKYKVLSEINMQDRTFKNLTTIVYNKDGTQRTLGASPEDYITPDTNYDCLYKMLRFLFHYSTEE
jgi:hypothetical protein